MTNGSKFKTAQERENAFCDFCEKNVCLNGCPLYKSLCDETRAKRTNSICHFAWLDLEAEEEKYHCVFCGKELKYRFDGEIGGKLVCECGYEEPKFERFEESLAAHNRVAKKCMEVK